MFMVQLNGESVDLDPRTDDQLSAIILTLHERNELLGVTSDRLNAIDHITDTLNRRHHSRA